MSLYNMLFGINEEAPVLLGMIGVNKEYFDRFRDIELIEGGTKIRVFTRLGGGNRKNYTKTWEKIKKHELYIKDYDDDFDCTYAYIEYGIPEKFEKTTKKMFKHEPIQFKDKFMKEINEMDIEGTKAYKNAEKIIEKFKEALEDSDNPNGNIHFIEL